MGSRNRCVTGVMKKYSPLDNMKRNYVQILFLSTALFSVIFTGCKKSSTAITTNANIPTVLTTSLILNLTPTTAQSGGIRYNDGNGTITANGVCYSSSNSIPTVADSKTTDTISHLGVANQLITSYLTGLTPNTTYYLRAYATNSAGTGYGGVLKFTTTDAAANIYATVTTLAGSGTAGYANGQGQSAMFNNPQGVVADSQGNIYVSDSFNNYIRKIAPDGTVTTFAGNGKPGYVDGLADSAEFYAPAGLKFDGQGNLVVADVGNNVIRKIDAAGNVTTYTGSGNAGFNGGTDNAFVYYNNPSDMAITTDGTMYIADKGNNAIRKVTPLAALVSTLAGNHTAGFVDTLGTLAYFNKPAAIAVDASGNAFVCDQANYSLRRITPAGSVRTIAGNPKQTKLINLPSGLAFDLNGNLFICDEGGRVLEYTKNAVLYVLAGSLNVSGYKDGAGISALFNNPQGITVDANGNIYVADQNNNCIRKITLSSTPPVVNPVL